ncbi:MAG: GGDEF domain-containing protein [Erythrobacter sp.]|uniref:GGDEF domain-containing protein n=1 Tax=Erythrobacter sp. TaxID=1042 RepID=UPI003C78B73B
MLDAQAGALQLGLALRLGVVAPAYLFAMWLLRTDKQLVLLAAAILPIMLFVGVAAYIGMHAEISHRDNYVMAASMLVSTCIILFPLRFRATAILAAGSLAAIAAPVVLEADDIGSLSNLLVFALLCSTLPLLIKRRSDHLKDANFLLTLRSRQAQDALLAANRELENLSDQDPLTGLLNRRGFEKRFRSAFEMAQTSGEPLAVLLMDLDHFKSFNDTHGHQLGDECLVQVGDLLKEEIARNRGISGRYGGEEFIVALTGSGSANAINIADRVRRKIANLQIRNPNGERAGMTASIGARIGRVAHLDRERFVEDADEALYTAKNEGRNRVVLFSRTETLSTEEKPLRTNSRRRYEARSASR